LIENLFREIFRSNFTESCSMSGLTPHHGADIRALRKARGVTLEELAGQLDRSVGWISQVERDISVPTPEDITDIAAALNVNAALLSGPANSPIVRASARRQIGPRAPGLYEEYLSPDLTDDFEVIHSTFARHAPNAGGRLSRRRTAGYPDQRRLAYDRARRQFSDQGRGLSLAQPL